MVCSAGSAHLGQDLRWWAKQNKKAIRHQRIRDGEFPCVYCGGGLAEIAKSYAVDVSMISRLH